MIATHRWKHWDYWASTLAAFAGATLIGYELMSVLPRGGSYVTFREIGIFTLSCVAALAAVGWNMYVVLDKYPDATRRAPITKAEG